MFKFTGVTEEAQSLAAPNAHQWDEYFGSLDETFAQPKVATATKVPASNVPHYPTSHDGKYQVSLHHCWKKRPVATPARALELASPQKRRKTEAVQEKFGFKVNDQVLWTSADALVPRGTKGTIVSFTDEKVRAQFLNERWLFKPEQLEKAIAAGHRLQVLPGHSLVDEAGIEYYTEGDKGTVESVDNKDMDNKFYVLWDRTCERTWHLSGKNFSIVGEAEFFVGKIVQRRDSDREWGTGRVTSIKPLMVTALDGPEARGYEWDEVRAIPEGSVEDHTEKPAADVELSPEKVKVEKKNHQIMQQLARVRKDACIAYLRAATV